MQAALEGSVPLAAFPLDGEVDVADSRMQVEHLVILREELAGIAQLAASLSMDQRLVLASQLSSQMRPADFCRHHGWSPDKYRKVAQRGRARLRRLLEAGEAADASRA